MMIEKTILDYLNDELDIPCFMEKPEHPPETYVLLEKTGSGRSNHICSSTFAIQSHAPSMYKTAELNLLVKRTMDGICCLNAITRCQLNSDYNFTDTAKKQYRYQAVYDITHYEE